MPVQSAHPNPHPPFLLPGKKSSSTTRIKSYVRCRPANDRERKTGAVYPPVVKCLVKEAKIHVARTQFHCDKVFDAASTQSDVYREIAKPIEADLLQGYNCVLFAYGQTGTGKTFTMEGDLSSSVNCGVIPRMCKSIFKTLRARDEDFSVKITAVELYNERFFECLEANASGSSSSKSGGNSTKVIKVIDGDLQNANEPLVESADDVMGLLKRAQNSRKVSATKMNKVSSRSHFIFILTVRMKISGPEGDQVKIGKLYLVDLAGSECIGKSGASGLRAREAKNINKSNEALKRVIEALVKGASHVPYRDSRLTQLLQPALGGSAKTAIIGTISPAKDALNETKSTLHYICMASKIQNQPKQNTNVTNNYAIKSLEREGEKLRRMLAAARSRNGIVIPPDIWEQTKARAEQLQHEVDEFKRLAASRAAELERHQRELQRLVSELDAATKKVEQQSIEIKTTKTELKQTQTQLTQETQRADDNGHLAKTHKTYATDLLGKARAQQQELVRAVGVVERQEAKKGRLGEHIAVTRSAVQTKSEQLTSICQRSATSAATFADEQTTAANTLASASETHAKATAEASSSLSASIDAVSNALTGQHTAAIKAMVGKASQFHDARVAAGAKDQQQTAADYKAATDATAEFFGKMMSDFKTQSTAAQEQRQEAAEKEASAAAVRLASQIAFAKAMRAAADKAKTQAIENAEKDSKSTIEAAQSAKNDADAMATGAARAHGESADTCDRQAAEFAKAIVGQFNSLSALTGAAGDKQNTATQEAMTLLGTNQMAFFNALTKRLSVDQKRAEQFISSGVARIETQAAAEKAEFSRFVAAAETNDKKFSEVIGSHYTASETRQKTMAQTAMETIRSASAERTTKLQGAWDTFSASVTATRDQHATMWSDMVAREGKSFASFNQLVQTAIESRCADLKAQNNALQTALIAERKRAEEQRKAMKEKISKTLQSVQNSIYGWIDEHAADCEAKIETLAQTVCYAKNAEMEKSMKITSAEAKQQMKSAAAASSKFAKGAADVMTENMDSFAKAKAAFMADAEKMFNSFVSRADETAQQSTRAAAADTASAAKAVTGYLTQSATARTQHNEESESAFSSFAQTAMDAATAERKAIEVAKQANADAFTEFNNSAAAARKAFGDATSQDMAKLSTDAKAGASAGSASTKDFQAQITKHTNALRSRADKDEKSSKTAAQTVFAGLTEASSQRLAAAKALAGETASSIFASANAVESEAKQSEDSRKSLRNETDTAAEKLSATQLTANSGAMSKFGAKFTQDMTASCSRAAGRTEAARVASEGAYNQIQQGLDDVCVAIKGAAGEAVAAKTGAVSAFEQTQKNCTATSKACDAFVSSFKTHSADAKNLSANAIEIIHSTVEEAKRPVIKTGATPAKSELKLRVQGEAFSSMKVAQETAPLFASPMKDNAIISAFRANPQTSIAEAPAASPILAQQDSTSSDSVASASNSSVSSPKSVVSESQVEVDAKAVPAAAEQAPPKESRGGTILGRKDINASGSSAPSMLPPKAKKSHKIRRPSKILTKSTVQRAQSKENSTARRTPRGRTRMSSRLRSRSRSSSQRR